MEVKRPILIDNKTAIVVWVFKEDTDFDTWHTWVDFRESEKSHSGWFAKNGAKEFIKQLHKEYTDNFLIALKKEITKQLKKS